MSDAKPAKRQKQLSRKTAGFCAAWVWPTPARALQHTCIFETDRHPAPATRITKV